LKHRKLEKRPRRPAPQFLTKPRELHGVLSHVDTEATRERIAAAVQLCDEPEKIGPAVLSYAEMANKADSIRHRLEVETAQEIRKTLTIEQRLATVAERAKHQLVDVKQDVFLIGKALERSSKGGRKLPMAALVRLEKVEARLDGVTDLPSQRAA
jgi:hypothetical protein